MEGSRGDNSLPASCPLLCLPSLPASLSAARRFCGFSGAAIGTLDADVSGLVELDLSFTAHAEMRIEQRGVIEVEVRAMLERVTEFEPSIVEGSFMIDDRHVQARGSSS